jgi:hypothetical protein
MWPRNLAVLFVGVLLVLIASHMTVEPFCSDKPNSQVRWWSEQRLAEYPVAVQKEDISGDQSFNVSLLQQQQQRQQQQIALPFQP